MDYTALDEASFAENSEPRCAVVLLLDTSTSMEGDAIDALNQGVQELSGALLEDEKASLRVELAVITFGNGGVQALDLRTGQGNVTFDAHQAFVPATDFVAPHLVANGGTPMGEATRRALTLVRERKEIYKAQSNDYFRPWIFLITDGQPNDAGWETAADAARQEEARKGVLIFPIAVGDADIQTLSQFSGDRKPLKLVGGYPFGELFKWASKSIGKTMQSQQGDQVALESLGGWGVITS